MNAPALLALAILAALPARAAEPGRFDMSLDSAVMAVLANSDLVRSLDREREAYRQRSGSQGALLLPQLTLDGSWRYAEVVPELAGLPGKSPVKLGDNESYSLGPTVTWMAWDWGASYQLWRSAAARAAAKGHELALARRQVRLQATVTYAQVQVAAEQVRLLADALKVAQAQHRDIAVRLEAGASSRIDVLQAHLEVLARKRMLAAARAELSGALRDLIALTGTGSGADTSAPLDAATAAAVPAGMSPASLIVAIDPLADTVKQMERFADASPDPAHPSVALQDKLVESSSRIANGLFANRLPRVTVQARKSRDYPNGPVLEEFTQTSLAVVASMPLFEWGKVTRDEWEQREMALAARERRDQAATVLGRDWKKARERLALLREQDAVNREAASETDELAHLIYESYQSGSVRFIEVQAANLRAVEARVQEARTRAEILGQLAILRSLAKEDSSQ